MDELREQVHAFLGSSLEGVFLELTEDGHERDNLGSPRFVFCKLMNYVKDIMVHPSKLAGTLFRGFLMF